MDFFQLRRLQGCVKRARAFLAGLQSCSSPQGWQVAMQQGPRQPCSAGSVCRKWRQQRDRQALLQEGFLPREQALGTRSQDSRSRHGPGDTTSSIPTVSPPGTSCSACSTARPLSWGGCSPGSSALQGMHHRGSTSLEPQVILWAHHSQIFLLCSCTVPPALSQEYIPEGHREELVTAAPTRAAAAPTPLCQAPGTSWHTGDTHHARDNARDTWHRHRDLLHSRWGTHGLILGAEHQRAGTCGVFFSPKEPFPGGSHKEVHNSGTGFLGSHGLGHRQQEEWALLSPCQEQRKERAFPGCCHHPRWGSATDSHEDYAPELFWHTVKRKSYPRTGWP